VQQHTEKYQEQILIEKENTPKSSRTKWHRWFGNLFKISLTPLGVDVQTDFAVMTDPPEADIVIIRKEQADWTPEQLKYLPDGIRDSRAVHIIAEFKFTESVNEDAFFQTAGYRIFYKFAQNLKNEDLQIFLISSKTPQKATLKKYGYASKEKPGIYQSRYPFLSRIILISLNDLADDQHNAFVRLFASKKKEKLAALKNLMSVISELPERLISYIISFWYLLPGHGGDNMDNIDEKLTPEERAEISKMYDDIVLSVLPAEEILSKFKPEERLAGLRLEERLAGLRLEERLTGLRPETVLSKFKLEERLAGLRPEEILSKFKIEELLAGLKPETVLSKFKLEERLAGLRPTERLAGLKPAEIKEYLNKIEQE